MPTKISNAEKTNKNKGSKTKPKLKADPKEKGKKETKVEAQPKVEVEAQPKVEVEAQPKVEVEPKIELEPEQILIQFKDTEIDFNHEIVSLLKNILDLLINKKSNDENNNLSELSLAELRYMKDFASELILKHKYPGGNIDLVKDCNDVVIKIEQEMIKRLKNIIVC